MDNIKKNSNYTIEDIQMRKLINREKTKSSIAKFFKVNKGKVIGLILSLLTLICLFNFGLFRTLGIWIVMAVGYLVGAYFDRDIKVLYFLRKVLN